MIFWIQMSFGMGNLLKTGFQSWEAPRRKSTALTKNIIEITTTTHFDRSTAPKNLIWLSAPAFQALCIHVYVENKVQTDTCLDVSHRQHGWSYIGIYVRLCYTSHACECLCMGKYKNGPENRTWADISNEPLLNCMHI